MGIARLSADAVGVDIDRMADGIQDFGSTVVSETAGLLEGKPLAIVGLNMLRVRQQGKICSVPDRQPQRLVSMTLRRICSVSLTDQAFARMSEGGVTTNREAVA